MFSKMIQAVVLSGSLIAAGAASANDRNVIVPVIAGAAVGAVLAIISSNSGHDNYQRPQYQGYQPQPRYQPQYQPVAYVPVRPRVEYRRFDPPHRGYYDRGPGHFDDRGYGNGHYQGRGDGRW